MTKDIEKIKVLRIIKYIDKIIIKLNNDKIIKCTANHKFLLRDGSCKKVEFLKIGSSLAF